MTFIQSPIKRFVKRLLSAIFILLAANALLLGLYAYYYKKSISDKMLPIPLLKTLSTSLVFDNKQFTLDSIAINQLDSQHLWAMLLDDKQGTILWKHNFPEELPSIYTLSDIALLSRYYLKDYPTYTWKHPQGLIVLGFPKNSMTKIIGTISVFEANEIVWKIIAIIICDLFILFFIYFTIDRKTLKSVVNILDAIKSLAVGKLIHLEEKGALSEIAIQLNKTSNLLEARSIAQENWIAGVSHDVRTPLSVILGYSEQIEQKETLPKDIREKAFNIKFQGVRLRNLVNDLNLVTRLGSGNMTVEQERFYPASFCRNLLANFLNDVSNDNYSLEIDLDREIETILIMGVPNLLQRAFYNLLYNSVKHNPNGCNIYFQLQKSGNNVVFVFSDDGEGMSVEQFEELQSRPHYLSCNESTLLQQHGLGLYVVQQIIKLHNATILFGSGKYGGFQSTITIPLDEKV